MINRLLLLLRDIAHSYRSRDEKPTKHHIQSALDWLITAQNSTSDRGVSAYFHYISGWAPSFIETTGYIIPTMINSAGYLNNQQFIERAVEMGDFVVSMQLPSGGFRTYPPSQQIKSNPTVFNTGQDIIGLVELYRTTGKKKYLISARLAADFLVRIQNKNGSWSRYAFGKIPHTYHSRVAYSLVLVYKETKNTKYLISAMKNLEWCTSHQLSNGWFEKANLPGDKYRFTLIHTLAYVIEGFLLSALELEEEKYLESAKRGIDPILSYLSTHTNLPAYFDHNWSPHENFRCPSGEAQFAYILYQLYQITKERKYLKAAKHLTHELRKIQNLSGNTTTHGGIPGCVPIYGDLLRNRGYCRLSYINWAAKYFVDALLLEEKIK